MKILQIDVSVNVGSTGIIAEEIGVKIISHGGDSLIAFGRYFKSSASKTIKIGNKIDQAFHLLQTRLFDNHGLASRKVTKTFIKEIVKEEPDIIHLHQIHGYYINIEVLFNFLRDFKKPVIWTIHDCWAFTGHCCYFSRVNCEKWKTECYLCPLTNYYPQSLFYDNSKENFYLKKMLFNSIPDLTLVSVSNWLAGILNQSFLNGNSIEIIYNGIDLDTFKSSESTHLIEKHNIREKIILGVAGTWSELKGFDDFLKLSKIIDSNTKIILIGLNDRQISTLPLNIIGVKETTNKKELAAYYSVADVFVNTSIAESFGLVTVEALACGTPVVAYNSTATPELIKTGTGILVEKHDINGLLNAVNYILKTGKKNYSMECRKIAEECFDRNVQFQKYIDLYKRILYG